MRLLAHGLQIVKSRPGGLEASPTKLINASRMQSCALQLTSDASSRSSVVSVVSALVAACLAG